MMIPGQNQHCRGMTMLDLLVSMGIAAILALVAAPNYDNYIRSNEVFADRKNFNTAIMAARYESVARSKTITLCASSDSSNCGTNWDDGWIIFQDDGAGSGGAPKDGVRNGDEAIVKATIYRGKNAFSMVDVTDTSTPLTYLSFNAYGRPTVDGKAVNRPILLTICDPKKEDKFARGLMLIGSGRVMQTTDSNNDGIHESRFVDGNRTISQSANLSCST